MRFATIVFIAGSMTAAAPALAQNAAEPATNAETNVVATTNETTAVTPTNEMAVPPAETTPAAETNTVPPPAPAKRSFPWGVLGLLGLVGLFGKRSRTG